MRGSSESAPARILQLCWDISSCFVWILVRRMELLLLTFVFFSILISFFFLVRWRRSCAWARTCGCSDMDMCIFCPISRSLWDLVLSVAWQTEHPGCLVDGSVVLFPLLFSRFIGDFKLQMLQWCAFCKRQRICKTLGCDSPLGLTFFHWFVCVVLCLFRFF